MHDGVEIAELWTYPVKGCRGVAMREAVLEPGGLAHDRRWMVVAAPGGRFLTQRELPSLARIVPTIRDGRLELDVGGTGVIAVPLAAAGQRLTVTVWRDTVEAIAPSRNADGALSEFLGRAVHLVRFPEDGLRPCDPTFAAAGSHTAFADGFPLLITNTASLGELNAVLTGGGGVSLPMRRFRPNLVVSGAPARAEDRHRVLEVESLVAFDLVKRCDRCIVTTTDQDTGERQGQEPLRSLRTIRRNERTGGVWFGQNAVPRLRPGDTANLAVGMACRFRAAES